MADLMPALINKKISLFTLTMGKAMVFSIGVGEMEFQCLGFFLEPLLLV